MISYLLNMRGEVERLEWDRLTGRDDLEVVCVPILVNMAGLGKAASDCKYRSYYFSHSKTGFSTILTNEVLGRSFIYHLSCTSSSCR